MTGSEVRTAYDGEQAVELRAHREGLARQVDGGRVLAVEALVLASLEPGQPVAVDGGGGHRRALGRITFRVSCLIGAGGGA